MNNKILAHIGLGLVTYGALLIYILFILATGTEADIDEIFGSGLFGVSGFFGFFATSMTFFGWILYIPALIISIRGLVKKDNLLLNGITLACSIGWLVAGYWVMTHFA